LDSMGWMLETTWKRTSLVPLQVGHASQPKWGPHKDQNKASYPIQCIKGHLDIF
jgi:hypothetical protein